MHTAAARSDVILDRLMALHPKVIDLTLDRMRRLLDDLGNPEQRLPPVVHVAGTNGKGSTLAMIRAGLEAGSGQVHAYTSPHLAWFHERIRLAGKVISEDTLAALLDECEGANGGKPITFFEITTAAAFLAFARTEADWTLLEVGLGGRLDATNVMTPRVSVITPVSIDHQQYLGDTLAEIAGEKAGIIKRQVPCIVGPQEEVALDVIEAQLARTGAPASIYGQHWHVWVERDRLVFQDERGLLDLPMPALRGPHQVQNAGTALAVLRELGVDEAGCEAAMTGAIWPARMQKLARGPIVDAADGAEVFLDGGHNPAAGQVIAATLSDMPARETHVVCGMLNTKDVAGFLRPLARSAKSLTAVSIPGEANTLDARTTADAARSVGFEAFTAASALEAVQRIAETAPKSRILICGSLYLAGRILRENG
ncbi:bifunctional folylpolyglutamate synthase/dihydrofolate synthase [Palleronia abyssalis]|uniref:Dihydrofolate synthase/folylpolyglutamate synthase n=1 Tax=Palleronia abyssalis TaxID=1501240 RepID=A0A2R8BSF7_9RHOB|nr:folylpolyglutamate synthase/dihydrofolate synthase family protein [Palleronia abyssalis]SPJ23055.1 Dihydrofolate synthase/folylpolyglutamate synthase [Palleronia abyssalis]